VPGPNTPFEVAGNTSPRKSIVWKVHSVLRRAQSDVERALRLHEAHSFQMGYLMFICSFCVRESSQSCDRNLRLSWQSCCRNCPSPKTSNWIGCCTSLFHYKSPYSDVVRRPRMLETRYIDAYIVLMNPQIPLESSYSLPLSEFDSVDPLATSDRHGLNDGCFLIRIND